jgi:flagellar hook assembly protein FlgD
VTRLAAIYPNPFNPRTTIAFDLAQAGTVEVAIFNIRGERVRMLESAEEPVGRYQATWDGLDDHGHDVATGTYICRLMTAHGSETKKMVLAR